ncbi:protein transport protein Sec16B [Pelodytes ibericus]
MDHGAHPWFNQSRGRSTAGMDQWRGMYPQPLPHHHYMNSNYGYYQKPHARGGHKHWQPEPWMDHYYHQPPKPPRRGDWGRPASTTEMYDRSDTFAFRPMSRMGYDERYGFYETAPRETHTYRDYYSNHQSVEEQEWKLGAQNKQTEQWMLHSHSGYPPNQALASDRKKLQPTSQYWTQDDDDRVADTLQSFNLHEPSLLSQYRDSGMSSSSYELSQYMHDPTDVSDSWQHMQEEPSECTPQPTAPLKFSLPHVPVCFGARGQLVRVCPNFPDEGQPALVEIHSMEVLLHDTVEQEEMRRFPGPMQREDLHKVDVINFCQQNVSQCLCSKRPRGHDDALLWQMLLQMCRQNGCIAGSDVAELLLQDRKKDSYRREQPNANLINLSEEPPLISDCVQMDLLTGEAPAADKASAQAMERFTKLLLHGRKKEALDWAMKCQLWGHALFLSSKLDPRTYSWVMGRFTDTLAQSDPLQTLFQLMAGRNPQAATCSGDSKWGDWRPHLAVILANQVGDFEINRRAIITMGDNLVLKGLTEAGHCCYLTAAIPFGHYYGKSDRLVLLGSSHSQSFQKFANSQSIQRTEILEYCQNLGKPGHCIPAFQEYKLIYATRLLDYGLTSLALHYCECIANAVLLHSGSTVLISELIKIADRLRYSDPSILERPETEQDLEPKWLIQLRSLLGKLQVNSSLYMSVNDQESRPTHAPDNIQIKSTGFTEHVTATEEPQETQTDVGLTEPQNTIEIQDSYSVWTPQYQTVQPEIAQSVENVEQSLPQLTSSDEFTSWSCTDKEPQAQAPASEDPSRADFHGAGAFCTQPPHPLRRVRTVSETSTVSVDEDDKEERSEEEVPANEEHERKKGSAFGWLGWFRSKPAKDVEPPQPMEHELQNEDSQSTQASADLYLPMSSPKTPNNPLSTNTGIKENEDPSNNNRSSVLSDIQGHPENRVTHPNCTLPVPGGQTSAPGGVVPLYNPSQFLETSRITNKPSRPARGRYPVQQR